MDLVDRNQSVQHVVATFPTELFSGDGTDGGGKISTMFNLIGYWLPLTLRPTSQSTVPEGVY